MNSKASSKVISQGHYTIVDLHDGIDGEDAKYITINGLNSFHYTDSNDTTPTPESITLTIIPNNITNYKVKWEYKIASPTGTWNTITSKDGCLIEGLTLKLNDKACFSVLTPITEFRATLTETETNKAYSCTHTISKIHDGNNGQDGNDGNDGQDGQDAYSCILTNESDTILFDQQNVVKPGQIGSSTCKAYSTIIAKRGTQNLNPVSDTITPSTGQYHFKFEPAPVNCTAKKHGDSSFYLDTVSDGKNNGKISITIYLEGKVNKIIKEYTWTKVIDGADAKYLILEGEDKFRYDNPTDTTPTPPTITLTATAFNIPNPTYVWKWFNGSMTQIVSGSGATISNNKLTIDDKKLFPNDAKTTKIQCEVIHNGKTYSDTLSVIKTYNGEDGPPGPPGNDAKSVEITGATQIHYNKSNIPTPSSIELTATAKNYTNANYKWYYIKSTGAELIPNQTTNKFLIEHNSSYFDGTDFAQIKVECRENNGTDMSFSQHTITKTHDGEDSSTLVLNIINGTRNVCYNGKEKLITTVITPFAIELFEDDKNVTSSSDIKSITWSCKGHYEVGDANIGAITFKPTPINNYDESKLDTYVSVTINYKGRIIKQSAPITVSKNSTAIDWVEEWDGSKVDIGGNYIISPKIFAGKKNNQTNRITGVALGQDIINKNQNIGMAIYYENNLIGRINSDPSIDSNKIIVFGSQPGKQFLVDINGGVIIEGGLKVSASSTTTTIGGIFDTATNAQSSATEASNKAEQAQSTASTAKTQAQQAIDRHDELSSDSKLTALEKLQVEKDFEEIKKEKPSIDNQADVYNISKVNYNNRYNELNNYLYGNNGLLVNMIKTTAIVRDDFKAKFNNYYTERQNILDLVASNSKEHARNYANDLVDNLNIGTENYILNTDFLNKENTYTSDGNISVNDGVITVTNANILKMDLAKSFSVTKMSNDIVMAAIATQTSSANVGLNKFIGSNINVYSEDHQYIVDSVKKLKTNMITVPIVVSIANATSSNPQVEDWALNRTKAYLDNLNKANLITKDTCLIFEPHPIINGGSTSETEFNPTNKEEFFNNWKKLIVDCMTALNGYKFYGIYVGTNFDKFDSSEQDLVYWDKLCKDLRALYNNHKILYRTNWWTTASWAEDLKAKYKAKLNNPLWSKVDIIAIAAYFELNDKKVPTVDELYNDITKGTSIYARGQNIYQEVKNFYDKWKKPVMFGELGCPSKEYGAMNPWSNLTTNVDNQVVQANYFEAYNKAFIYENTELDNSWFLGYSIFTVGTSTTEYDVVNKQAQSIITKGIDFINNNASLNIRCQINDKVTNKTITDFDLPLSQMMNNVQSVTTKLVYDATSTSEIVFNLKPNATFTMSKPILSSGTKASSWTRSSEDIEREIEKANEAAKKAQTDAQKANNRHDELASDSKLTPLEKLQVEKDFEEIKKEKPSIENQANVYSISKTNYTNKYNELNTYLYGGSGILNDIKVTTTITRNDFKTKFNNYYTERQNILDLVASKTKEYADTSINNIQIGTSNIIRNSKNPSNKDYWTFMPEKLDIKHSTLLNESVFTITNSSSTTEKCVGTQRYILEGGKTYYFSFKLYIESNVNSVDVFFLMRRKGSNTEFDYAPMFVTSYNKTKEQWHKVEGFLTIPNDAHEGFIRVDHNGSISNSKGNQTIWFTELNLVQTNKEVSWTPSIYDIQDNIQIGGRNLVIKSNDESTYSKDAPITISKSNNFIRVTKNTTDVSSNYGVWKNVKVEPNTKYTISLKVGHCDGARVGIGSFISGNSAWSQYGYYDFEPNKIFSKTFTTLSNETEIRLFIAIRLDKPQNTYLEFINLQLEKGNKASDYTPAQEDIEDSINKAKEKGQEALNKHSDMANDNKLTPIEKQDVKKEWDIINGEKQKIIDEANKLSITTQRDAYTNAYNSLNSYITPLISDLSTTSDINGSAYRSKFTDYYNKRQDLLNAISTKLKTIGENAQSTANNAQSTANEAQKLAQSMANGKILYADQTFRSGYNNVSAYNNGTTGAVTVNRKEKISGCPTNSPYCLEVKSIGGATPGHGGFYHPINSRANAIFIQKFLAKLPSGYTFALASNQTGTGSSERWLTDNRGTGTWKEYIREVKCGSSGTFSTSGHVYVSGGTTPTPSSPLVWHIASATVIDITDSDERINDVTTWKKEVENKITDDGITTTIKNALDTNGVPVFAQTHVMNQTVNNLELKFSQIGGYNILKNSGFLTDDMKYWILQQHNNPTGSWSIKKYTHDWGFPDKSVNTFEIRMSNQSSKEYGLSQWFNTTIGKTYTVSFYYASHRCSKANMIIRYPNSNWLNNKDFNPATKEGGNSSVSSWGYFTYTFKATHTEHILNIVLTEAQNDGYMWVAKPQIVEGSIALPYSPNPDEVYCGITSIDKDGIKISMEDGEGVQGYTKVNYEGLGVYNSSGQRKAWFGEGDSAFIDRLETKHIIAPNVVNKYVYEINLYVGPTQLGNGSGLNWSNRIGGIGNAIQIVRRDYGEYIHGFVNIHVADGEYYENQWIEGIHGAGDFIFYLSMETYVVGSWNIVNMGKPVKIKGGRGGEDINNGARLVCDVLSNDAAHIAVRNSYLELDNIRAYNRNAGDSRYRGSFVYVADGGSALIWASDFSRYMYGLLALNCSIGNMALCRGYCYYPIVARYGSHITTSGYPKGKENSWSDYGGEIHSWGTQKESLYDPDYEAAPAPPPPPTPTYKWVEQNFSLSNLRSIPEGSGSGTTARSGEWGQGKWGSYKPHRGYADLGDSPSSWCSGARNITVTLTMTRLSTSHGQAGAVPRPRLKEPNGNFWDSGKAFARGATHSITLPSTIADAIANGSMKTLEMWAGTSTNDYSFYNNTTIKITCEKQV